MALITCPDCQTLVSDAALACPKCGRPAPIRIPPPVPRRPGDSAPNKEGKKSQVFAGLALLCLVVLVLAIAGNSRNADPAPSVASTPSANEVGRWANQIGFVALAKRLASDMGDISAAGKNQDFTATKRACQAFQGDLVDLEAVLPAPDPDLTMALRSAHRHYARSAELCITGVASFNAADLQASAAEMAAGSAAIEEGTAIIKRHQ